MDTTTTQPRYPKRKRADVQYNDADDDTDASTDFEDYVPVKRSRTQNAANSKPLPPRKIFPFLSLPAELRNRIYRECFPPPTKGLKLVKNHGDGPTEDPREDAIWFEAKQKSFRRTVQYIPSLVDPSGEQLEDRFENVYGVYIPARRGTGRGGRPSDAAAQVQDSDSDEEHEDASPASTTFNLNILAVCQQIYSEAAPMFFTRPLVFIDVDALFAFVSGLSLRTAKLLRHIEIRSWSTTRSRKSRGFSAIAMLAAKGVTELESLYINCRMAWFSSWSYRAQRKSNLLPKRIARKVYRDCYPWLEAVGSASGDLFKGIEVLKIGDIMFEGGEFDPEQDPLAFKKELRRLLAMNAL